MAREKRKTWKDRNCGHGKPDWRMTLEIISCKEPGCFEEKLAHLGWRPMTEAELAARKAEAR